MLESMTTSRLPTRAEATDVANAILDGTDCVMLSGESAMGKFPEEAVTMLARIAAATESYRTSARSEDLRRMSHDQAPGSISEIISNFVEHVLETVPFNCLVVPTHSGQTARMISRYKPQIPIYAFCRQAAVCQGLLFSYGVAPVEFSQEPEDWGKETAQWLKQGSLPGPLAVLVVGPSQRQPGAHHRVEFVQKPKN
jgi:pyruvate kinase